MYHFYVMYAILYEKHKKIHCVINHNLATKNEGGDEHISLLPLL